MTDAPAHSDALVFFGVTGDLLVSIGEKGKRKCSPLLSSAQSLAPWTRPRIGSATYFWSRFEQRNTSGEEALPRQAGLSGSH